MKKGGKVKGRQRIVVVWWAMLVGSVWFPSGGIRGVWWGLIGGWWW